MATVTIDASTPSASVNYAVLKSTVDKILEMHRRGQINVGADGYRLLFELVYASTDGKTNTGTTSQAVVTYS